MIRDRLIDGVELVVGMLRAIVHSISLTDLQLPRSEEAADWVLVVIVGCIFPAVILHGIYDLTLEWFA
jgi:hypothetical protein